MSYLIIEGARQNNLKNISLKIPHDQLVVITGLSGSGKSSLAFDTIFAEGQWRFIESLSSYARLYIEKLDRPDVDKIQNIRPAIALEQKNPVKGSRSTVGTLTEIYDLLRVLYSKISRPYCPSCNKEIKQWSPEAIVNYLLQRHNQKRCVITFPSSDRPEDLIKRGFYRFFENNETRELSSTATLPQNLQIVVDRTIIRQEARFAESIELAFKQGNGCLTVFIFESRDNGLEVRPVRFSKDRTCEECNITLAEPAPILFSFNHPIGACNSCNGFGNTLRYDESLIVPDPTLSIQDGAIEPWEKPAARWWKEQLIKGAKKAGIDVKKAFSDLSEEEKSMIFKGCHHFYGIEDFFDDLEAKRYKLHVRVFLSRYRSAFVCPECKGKRLRPEALAYRLAGLDIAELSKKSIDELDIFFRKLSLSKYEKEVSKEIIKQIEMKITFLKDVGLGYLTLDRLGKTLSGGEYQRVNLANQIASRLTGTLYVLDEPTIGLHPRDTKRIMSIIKDMVRHGNTVLVVEHDASVIKEAEWIVEMGPGSGQKGGEVIFSGPLKEFFTSGTTTSRYLKNEFSYKLGSLIRYRPVNREKQIILKGATGHNLKNITLKIPLGSLIAVTGVSGSGKSSLIVETLYRALARHFKISFEHPLPFKELAGIDSLKGVKLIDQSPIGKTPRSNPATYLKIFDLIRRLYAEQPYAVAHGYTPGFFSFNVPGGRCQRCSGEGYEKLEMYFFEDLYVRCEHCHGRRYSEEALKVTYKEKNIYQVLQMTVDEAIEFFRDEEGIVEKLLVLKDIGLGYLKLGQPATTLSGGEAQRLKICSELSNSRKTGFLYILDEPTVGLHYLDVLSLIGILQKLVDEGNTVVVIEHNLDFIKTTDWVIDLGPEGGPDGGKIVFEGTPDDLIDCKNSHTGRFLRELYQ
ncbi:MAG: excinuclease ABC subunit UvrA [Nitrospirae bacterium]|nr:excinuclease ABC subunit UvrA [Nitrospirota bacterium]